MDFQFSVNYPFKQTVLAKLYLWSEVSREPQGELCCGRMLSEVQQTRRVSVVQCGGLSIIGNRWVAVIYRRLPVISERRMAEVRFDILSGFYLWPVRIKTELNERRGLCHDGGDVLKRHRTWMSHWTQPHVPGELVEMYTLTVQLAMRGTRAEGSVSVCKGTRLLSRRMETSLSVLKLLYQGPTCKLGSNPPRWESCSQCRDLTHMHSHVHSFDTELGLIAGFLHYRGDTLSKLFTDTVRAKWRYATKLKPAWDWESGGGGDGSLSSVHTVWCRPPLEPPASSLLSLSHTNCLANLTTRSCRMPTGTSSYLPSWR